MSADLVAILGFIPPLTVDQVELMLHDNVVRPGALGLGALGIQATAAEVILPTYLDRFRLWAGRRLRRSPRTPAEVPA